MEHAVQPSSQRQRTSGGGSRGGGGGDGACIGDLPDALLSLIFENIEYPDRSSVALTCPRWHRMLHTTPSLWRYYNLSAPADILEVGGWEEEDQEEWLGAKLHQLRRVSPAVECLTVEDTVGADVMPDLLQSVAASQLTSISTFEYDVALPRAAMRALASLTRLQDVSMGSTRHALPTNCSWAIGKLTALTSLGLESSSFPADLPAAVGRLPQLADLFLGSADPLPDVQPLTALEHLRDLELSESATHEGLAVLPAAHFPHQTYVLLQSPLFKVGDLHLVANGNQASCKYFRYPPSLALRGVSLTASGAVPSVVHALKPAGQALKHLNLSGCPLSEAAWHPAGELDSVTELTVELCEGAEPGASLAAALNAALQQMSRLRNVSITNCDLSSGLPEPLCQLSSITHLVLRGTQLATLPRLACMAGLRTLSLDYNRFTQLPLLGSAPNLTSLRIDHNLSLVLDAASVDRLADEAPNLKQLNIGGTAAAAIRLVQRLPGLAAA